MPELPHIQGFPSYHSDSWDPFFSAMSDLDVVMCLHIGQGLNAINLPDINFDEYMVLSTQVTVLAVQDLLWGHAMRQFPDLKIAFSEGGIGWLPFLLDRVDRHYENQRWTGQDFGSKRPSDVLREHSLACFIADPTSLKLYKEIGIDMIAFETDYPHSDCLWPDAPEALLAQCEGAGCSDEDIEKISWRNAARFCRWDPFATIPRSDATVGALRAQASDVETGIVSREEWRARYEADALLTRRPRPERRPDELERKGEDERMASQPMQGVRVVEVAQYTFVPAAGAVLAEWGAEVIKVEHAERGDAQRGLFTVGSMSSGGPFAPLMEHPNHNKRSIGLALDVPEGLAILQRLVRNADVFLTNLLPGARSRLHVDVEDMRKVNPRIIYVRGTALGVRGEDRTRPGFDGISYWYRAGSAFGATPPNVEGMVPMPAPAYGDSIGGMTIAGGVSAALFARERTGEPSVVDVSLLGVGAWANALAIETSFLSGQPWQNAPMGSYQSVATNPLVGVFATKDGRWIGLSMLQPGRFWDEFCRHLGREDLVTDPRFDTTEKVIANAEIGRRDHRGGIQVSALRRVARAVAHHGRSLGARSEQPGVGTRPTAVGERSRRRGDGHRRSGPAPRRGPRPIRRASVRAAPRSTVRGAHRRDPAGARSHGVGALGVEAGRRRHLIRPTPTCASTIRGCPRAGERRRSRSRRWSTSRSASLGPVGSTD